MRRFLILATLLYLTLSARILAIEFQFGTDGVDFDTGSLGKFTLSYPQLLDGSQKPVHKLLEKKPPGKVPP